MIKRINTIKDAAKEWVNEFNAIPSQVIEKICKCNIDSIHELTTPEDEYTGFLPMWGTLWTFGCTLDEDWARENIEIMQKYGFRVYEQDDFGLLFGIDGAGYDFYEAHWIPLYKAHGLHWHSNESEAS